MLDMNVWKRVLSNSAPVKQHVRGAPRAARYWCLFLFYVLLWRKKCLHCNVCIAKTVI